MKEYQDGSASCTKDANCIQKAKLQAAIPPPPNYDASTDTFTYAESLKGDYIQYTITHSDGTKTVTVRQELSDGKIVFCEKKRITGEKNLNSNIFGISFNTKNSPRLVKKSNRKIRLHRITSKQTSL